MESTVRPPLCIYHGNCADGFGGAWVFKRYAPIEFEFYAGDYKKAPPDVTDRHVYLVDFSYKRPVVEKMLEECSRLVYIDHHEAAINDMAPLIQDGYIEALVAQEHSGAVLAWKYWNKTEREMPALLRHIEDRDLWRFALAHTREIQANVFSYPYDFDVWDTLMKTPLDELARDGVALERKHMKDILELIEVTERRMVIGDIEVPVANLPYTMSSDAAQILAQRSKASFAACYFDTADGRSFSLRSPAGGLNVCSIAQQYGGGGHVHASGFSVPSDHPLAKA